MTTITRLLEATTTSLGPNRIEAIAGTSNRARDGHIVEMAGMDTSAFQRAGTILFGHDPSQPVGTPASVRVDSAGNLRIVVDFAPDGVSDRASEVKRLVKAGIIRNLSIGFDPIEGEPLDPKKPRGGQRVTRSELLEVSFVSVPADAGAVVTARSGRSGKVLSGTNADALRGAHDLAEQCRSTIADVLDGAGEGQRGRDRDFDHRQRQAEALALAPAAQAHLRGDATYERRQRQKAAVDLALEPRARRDNTYARRQRDLAAINRLLDRR